MAEREANSPSDGPGAGAGEKEGSQNDHKPPVTAFVSWAHDDEAWEKTIAAFVFTLRYFGIIADVDLFHLDDQDVNWTTYGPKAIEDADIVLIAASLAYKARWEGRNDPREGAGAAREANVLKTIFNDDQKAFLHKVKVVVLPGANTADIPAELKAASQRFDVGTIDLAGLEELLRNLTRQPRLPTPPVGEVPYLPPTLLDRITPAAGSGVGSPEEDARELRQGLSEVERQLESAPPDEARAREDLRSKRSTMKAGLDLAEAAPARWTPRAPGSEVVARSSERLDLFYIRDGGVATKWWDPSGGWQGPATIAPRHTAAPGAVAAVARQPEHLDVFWISGGGAVGSNWWDASSGWGQPFAIARRRRAAPGAVAAIARQPEHLDVFWIGRDGAVITSSWEVRSGWSRRSTIAPPGAAAPGAVAAVARQPDHLDVFWISPDGAVGTTCRDEKMTDGNWNSQSFLTPPGQVDASPPVLDHHRGHEGSTSTHSL